MATPLQLEGGLLGSAPVAGSGVCLALTRKHYTRLRFYWRGGKCGAPSLADNFDLDLAAAGLITRREQLGYGLTFAITHDGEIELAAEKAREIERRRPHHDFAGRLACWLRDQGRVTWENIELRADIEGGGRQPVRPDVFSLAKTYDAKRINPCIHEVKISRADFHADLAKPEKRAGYARIAEVLYYAAPSGLIQPCEIPDGCGLVVELEEGCFSVLKKPKKRRVELTAHHFMNLILKPGVLDQIW